MPVAGWISRERSRSFHGRSRPSLAQRGPSASQRSRAGSPSTWPKPHPPAQQRATETCGLGLDHRQSGSSPDGREQWLGASGRPSNTHHHQPGRASRQTTEPERGRAWFVEPKTIRVRSHRWSPPVRAGFECRCHVTMLPRGFSPGCPKKRVLDTLHRRAAAMRRPKTRARQSPSPRRRATTRLLRGREEKMPPPAQGRELRSQVRCGRWRRQASRARRARGR